MKAPILYAEYGEHASTNTSINEDGEMMMMIHQNTTTNDFQHGGRREFIVSRLD